MSKKARELASASGAKKTSREKVAEYVDNLLKLHKLQGVLLTQLRKEV